MADEEQFSLCWNNFNSNLSAGFHESLCRGDLVDVTLAAEGHLVKAHRLVLSVCSPYFRKMFTQMPANQHAFVFLKDVSHAALKDLIQFMYCGEVNVKQDALPTFISTAEALQIKGLTETGDAATTPASAQSPAKVPTPAPSTTSTTATTTSPRTRGIQRNVSRTSYKIDSEDSSDDRPIIPAATTTTQQKRLIQRSLTPVSSVPAIKRIKTTADPLEESDDHQQSQQLQHQTQQLVDPEGKDETEFIDLPIESLPTKAEPDYGEEDAGEVEAVEQDVNYVEDDSYGDMKYDESYFTENEDAKAGASGFADQSYAESGGGDQSANEAQGTVNSIAERITDTMMADVNPGGLVYMNYFYHKSGVVKNGITYYRCSQMRRLKCQSTLKYDECGTIECNTMPHNHPPKMKNKTLFSGKKLMYKGVPFYRHCSSKKKIHWRCYQSINHCSMRLHTDSFGKIIKVISGHKHRK